ncbi:hypothetical protein IQ07DRAFT_582508 [Pyrenochaeta sp. DS3sAY3a]|nr:hypothetical protein IQ07DRAFT_582508 [Pyrenochaeta sp. DS3sAY3a]
MDPSTQVSSLYGPGAFFGWLCTILSVAISWTFNRHQKGQDTIDNDLIAALLFPSIAAINFQYDFWSGQKVDVAWLITVEATSAVRIWYLLFGHFLAHWISRIRCWKRSTCIYFVLVLCYLPDFYVLVWSDPGSSWLRTGAVESVIREHVSQLMFQAMSHSMLCLASFVGYVALPFFYRIRFRGRTASQDVAIGIVSLVMGHLSAVAMRVYFVFYNFYPSPFSWMDRSILQLLSIPQSGHSLKDLDQAVALSAGLLTLMLSIKHTIASRRSQKPLEEVVPER